MSRAPAFLAAVAFACGIALGALAWRPPLWWLVAAIAFAAAAACIVQSKRLAFVFALLGLSALGALEIGARDGTQPPVSPELQGFLSGDDVLVTAHVLADSTTHARGGSSSESVDLETECIAPLYPAPKTLPVSRIVDPQPLRFSEEGPSIYASMRPQPKQRRTRKSESAPPTPGPCVPLRAGLRITAYPHETREDEDAGGGSVRKFAYGERLRFIARLRPPRNFQNPGAWDYVAYLRGRGIVALGSARADRIEPLPGLSGARLAQWRAGIRRSVLQRIAQLWPGRSGGLIAAMVIGDRSGLPRDVRAEFQRTGVYHVLVVSGMNVGIIAAVVFWVLRRMRVRDLFCAVVAVVLSCAYALLTDGGAPILRATLMLAIYLGARLLYRERAALNSVGVAALVLLVADPRALFDASFQLTFVSVAAIAGIALPLLERSSIPYRKSTFQLDALAYDLTLPPRLAQFRLDLRLLDAKLGRLTGRRMARFALLGSIRPALSAFDLVVVAAVAQCALALPMAVYFHRAVLGGLPANLVVVPLAGVLMPAAAAAVALSYLSPALAYPAAWIAGSCMQAITAILRVVGGWRASDWRLPTPEAAVVCGCAIAIAFCLWAARQRRWVAAAGVTALAVSAACVALVPPRAQLRRGVLEFTAIDVGQADSTLVITPHGRTVLIDAAGTFGPMQSEFDFGEDVISPYLWSRGITRLDAVALTHAHSDHIGGMRSLLVNFRPRELWMGPNAPDPLLTGLLEQTRSLGIQITVRRAPEEFTFGGAKFRVLSPPAQWQLAGKVRNQDSLLLRIAYGKTAALITGDADIKVERLALAADPEAAVLHVAHNGSATSTSGEFLDAVRPEFAVISVGARNPFRHPRAEVLKRLGDRRVRTVRTDTTGLTSFYLDGQSVTADRLNRH